MSHSERLVKLEQKAEAKRLRTLPIAISWDLANTVVPPSDAQDSRKPSSLRITLTPGPDDSAPVDVAMDPEPPESLEPPEGAPRCARGHVRRGQRCGTCIRADRDAWLGPPAVFTHMQPTTIQHRRSVKVVGADWIPIAGWGGDEIRTTRKARRL